MVKVYTLYCDEETVKTIVSRLMESTTPGSFSTATPPGMTSSRNFARTSPTWSCLTKKAGATTALASSPRSANGNN